MDTNDLDLEIIIRSKSLRERQTSYGIAYPGVAVRDVAKSRTLLSDGLNWLLICGILKNGTAAATAKLRQSCLILCDPRDGSPPIPVILQARTLEWVAISFSNAWKWKMKVKSSDSVRLLATPWTAAYQAPPSMGFSRQEYWSGVPLKISNGTEIASV